MWQALGAACNTAAELWLAPLRALPVAVQLGALALPLSIGAAALRHGVAARVPTARARERMQAQLLELVLFGGPPRAQLRSLARLIRSILAFLARTSLGLAPALPLLALGLAQVESRFAYRPLEPGSAAIVTLDLAGDRPASQRAIELEPTPGLALETPALRIDREQQVLWRVRAAQPGVWALAVSVDGARAERRVAVGPAVPQVTPRVYAASPWVLTHPGETPLAADAAAAGVYSLSIEYPQARPHWCGASSAAWIWMAWLGVFSAALQRLERTWSDRRVMQQRTRRDCAGARV